MNKQPFYHRVDGLLFTATRELSETEFLVEIRGPLKKLGVIPESIEIETWGGAEPGDPSDLM